MGAGRHWQHVLLPGCRRHWVLRSITGTTHCLAKGGRVLWAAVGDQLWPVVTHRDISRNGARTGTVCRGEPPGCSVLSVATSRKRGKVPLGL